MWTFAVSNPDLFLAATQTPNEPLGLYAYGKRLLQDRPDIGVAFARAFIRSVNTYFNGDYHQDDRTMSEIAKVVANYDIATNKKYDSLTMDWEIRRGTTTRVQELFIDIGVLTYPKPLAEDKIVDRSFYEKAVGKIKE